MVKQEFGRIYESLRKMTASRRFISEMQQAAIPYTAARTTMLYTRQRKRWVRIGNAVIVEIGGHCFLFTVAHVLDAGRGPDGEINELWVKPFDTIDELIDLGGSPMCLTDRREYHDRFRDPLDVGCIRLDRDRSALLLARAKAVTAVDFEQSDLTSPQGYYFIHGLPGTGAGFSWRHFRFQDETLAFGSELYEGQNGRAEHYHPACHLEMRFDGYGFCVADWARNRKLPELPGVSGSGLWRLHAGKEMDISWSPDKIRLVGIVQSNDRATLTVRGSRVEFFLHMIAARFPEFQPTLARLVAPVGLLVQSWVENA